MTDASPPTFQTLRVELDGTLGRLTLAQPDRLNPLGAVALQELADAARWFDGTDAAVVVVAGEGRAFSAGFDLKELEAPTPGAVRTPELGAAMADAIESMRALTVAAVQGPCVGGGFVLALCCDLRVADDAAWCSLPEAALGIPLAWGGVPRLVRAVGAARATDLILTCRRAPASELAGWGLFDRVVPVGQLADAVDELVAPILALHPDVVTTTKRQVADVADELASASGDAAGTHHLEAALRALRAPEGG